MKNDELKNEIKARIPCTDFLRKAPKGGQYICPECKSGTGKNGTGAVKYYPETNTASCHKCKAKWDSIDLIQAEYNMTFTEALKWGADKLGLPYPGADAAPKVIAPPPTGAADADAAADDAEAAPPKQKADYTQYYRRCRERLKDPAAQAYLIGRGISYQTAHRLWIGFDPAADPATAPGAADDAYKAHPAPRLIMPTSKSHYVARAIDPTTDKDYAKLNPKGGEPGIFHKKVLKEAGTRAIFVTEGIFDALSIEEAGGRAVALNSTANADRFLKELSKSKTEATLILALDNDEPGLECAEKLRVGIEELGIGCILSTGICGNYKDPNEALYAGGQKGRQAFFEAVQAEMLRAAKPYNMKTYFRQLMAADVRKYKEGMTRKTGFGNLDKEIGGLYSGLYVIAAISSLGKTTFAVQLADQLAYKGHEVLFFAIEPSKLEIASKSIVRTVRELQQADARKEKKDRKYGDEQLNKEITSRDIRCGSQEPIVKDAIDLYLTRAEDRVNVIEGTFSISIAAIRREVERHINATGIRPVVFVDYLQALEPEPDKAGRTPSTKEAVDGIVKGLKRLSVDYNIPVIAISSVNRANYLTPIDFESLKESGMIEFSADAVWGLQLACFETNDKLADPKVGIKEKRSIVEKAKTRDPRQIQLKCLKNRNGKAIFTCDFDYYPQYETFEVVWTAEDNS